MTITDSAIILSREPWRESDKRVVFYTLQHGKINAVAIGAHKIRSKLAGHLEPVRAVDVMVASGKQSFKIAQCVTRHNFIDHPIDVMRVRMMGTLVRFVETATITNHRDTVLYELLFTALAQMQAANQEALNIIFGQQLFLLAQHFGYAPQFDQCVICGTTTELHKFSSQLGGVICKNEQVTERTVVFNPDVAQRYLYISDMLRWRGLI